MPLVYDNVDLVWIFRDDFALGHDGDIADTTYDPLRSLYQEIRTRLKADLGDWILNKEIGAGMSDYVGEPNNKSTAEALKTRIIGSLTKFGLIASRDLKVSYIPIDIDKIMFRISIAVAATAANKSSTELLISTIYNYSENNVYIV